MTFISMCLQGTIYFYLFIYYIDDMYRIFLCSLFQLVDSCKLEKRAQALPAGKPEPTTQVISCHLIFNLISTLLPYQGILPLHIHTLVAQLTK